MELDLQPTLQGTLVELRPLRPEDFEPLFQAASDPLIWEQHPESDRYKRDVFQKFFDGAMESKGAFAIIDRKSGRIIGSSRYWGYRPDQGEVEIGWTFLERAFWGGPYNRELKSLMLDHALQCVERVLFIVGETNYRSQKALQKIGAELLKKIERPVPGGAVSTSLVFVIKR